MGQNEFCALGHLRESNGRKRLSFSPTLPAWEVSMSDAQHASLRLFLICGLDLARERNVVVGT